jgi:hypothetical protein
MLRGSRLTGSAAPAPSTGCSLLVLRLLAFLHLAAVVAVLFMEINVVWVDRLSPRALLIPFTDAVDFTPGDRRSYTGQGRGERQTGSEALYITFDSPNRAGEDSDHPAG